MTKTTFSTSFSLLVEERPVLDDFKEICRKNRISVSAAIAEFIAKAVQADKEGKRLRYEVIKDGK